jgi:hypothetical protein
MLIFYTVGNYIIACLQKSTKNTPGEKFFSAAFPRLCCLFCAPRAPQALEKPTLSTLQQAGTRFSPRTADKILPSQCA